MKFLVCIFISFFCVFAQAQDRKFLSLDRLIDGVTNKRPPYTLLGLAKQGSTEAQLTLAGVYLKEHYDKENTTKASDELKRSLYWFTKAANRGNTKAQTILGTIYCCSNSWNFRAKEGFFFKSTLVEKDWEKAFRWFKKAAARGNPEAQHQIAARNSELEQEARRREEIRQQRRLPHRLGRLGRSEP